MRPGKWLTMHGTDGSPEIEEAKEKGWEPFACTLVRSGRTEGLATANGQATKIEFINVVSLKKYVRVQRPKPQ